MDISAVMTAACDVARKEVGSGRVADYIPALARVDPERFGMAVVAATGEEYGCGDWQVPFSIQSISKVFTLALVLAAKDESIWRRVGREPSGNPFNSLIQLEYEQGIPRNPFINAGALVVTDRLLSISGDAWGALREFLRSESGNELLDNDAEVAESEAGQGHRNAALAHFMAAYGNLENPVEEVLRHYYAQCATTMTCLEVARAGLLLARHGQRAGGEQMLSRSDAKRINAVMLTCGTYDAAGEFAYRVGLPGKSGVGGGILAVIPGRCSICVWSPGLDSKGNSVAGMTALDAFTTMTGWSVF